jgi:hypothetical protein
LSARIDATKFLASEQMAFHNEVEITMIAETLRSIVFTFPVEIGANPRVRKRQDRPVLSFNSYISSVPVSCKELYFVVYVPGE